MTDGTIPYRSSSLGLLMSLKGRKGQVPDLPSDTHRVWFGFGFSFWWYHTGFWMVPPVSSPPWHFQFYLSIGCFLVYCSNHFTGLARTSSVMWNWTGEGRHLSLLPALVGKAFSLPRMKEPLSVPPIAEGPTWVLNFVKGFLGIYQNDPVGFSSVHWLSNDDRALDARQQPHLLSVRHPFNPLSRFLVFLFCWAFLRLYPQRTPIRRACSWSVFVFASSLVTENEF